MQGTAQRALSPTPGSWPSSPLLLLVGSWLLALRGLDLRLAAARAPDPSIQAPWVWFIALLGTALLGGLSLWLAQRFYTRPRARTFPRLVMVLGVYSILFVAWIDWPSGWQRLLWPLRSTLEAALLLLISSSVVLGSPQQRTRLEHRWICALLLVHLGVHIIEHALGHAVLPLLARCALQAGYLATVVFLLFRLAMRPQSFETRVTALCLGIPLLVRVACVGSWTALLGVPAPEAFTGVVLGVWGLCGLALCASTFPRQKGMSFVLFGLCAGLGTGAIFLVFFHYLHRFGRIQVFFDAFSTALFGVHFPYPQWQSPAFAAAFAVSCVFVVLLILRKLGTPGLQRHGMALGLWMATGIGLTRSSDLVILLFILLALPETSPGKQPIQREGANR